MRSKEDIQKRLEAIEKAYEESETTNDERETVRLFGNLQALIWVLTSDESI